MNSPTLKTVKHLFAVSSNRCAFPACSSPLVEESGTVTGEIAHIRATSPNGPRHDPAQTIEERHGFANLILLCGRHHAIIDTEVEEYPVPRLEKMKHEHETKGTIEIGPFHGMVAQRLLDKCESVAIFNIGGNVAYKSPGAIQAQNVNLKTTKNSVKVAPPSDAVGAIAERASYVEYLIHKYQDYQKQDLEKEGNRKYMLIYQAIQREYGSKWQTVPLTRFEELVSFLQRRIDNTKVGRIRKSRGQKRYHSFEEHNRGDGRDDT
ncbi:MAG: hypothetical protein ACN6P1_24060 [Pseudomonas sp.]|uniref:hypothetical protein n=1 Tax=Pseudomonas sp. TaxID=306 RepID=UPI003D0F19C3